MTYLPGIGSIDWSKLGADLGNTAVSKAAEVAADAPAVRINRARIASMVQLGYATMDGWELAKPWVFLASLTSAAASGWGIYKRKKVPEAVTLYSITGVISLALAYASRPSYLRGSAPVPPAADAQAPSAFRQALAWTDGRVERLSREQPGWESRTLARLWTDLGNSTMNPAVSALLTRNGR